MRKLLKVLLLMLFPFVLLEIGLRLAGIGGSIVYVEDPVCGYRPRPSQRFATMGHPIRINAEGYRGPSAITNLLFVGDSVTYGTAYVRDEDTFPTLLGGANAGVNGWGLPNVARFLNTLPSGIQQTVIWTIPTCDVLRPFMTLRAGLISTNRRMWFRTEYLLRFLWYGHLRPQPAPVDPAAYEENEREVLASAARLRDGGTRLLFVFLPYRAEALGSATPDTPYAQRLEGVLRNAGYEVLRADPGSAAPACYRDPAHLTPGGNRWLAERIRERLGGTS